ncbi:hypothetical protein EJ08DRAFT_654501 [Tothia fuscella]|uniref:Uncharacterized protein n=1 Tax=Tothia fuscella TaxID=1048955 RepID=A0A9P4TST3_9PEZI|nr:hypothetical protein EJ08DRAFT_654501 [Tothia fuscella]
MWQVDGMLSELIDAQQAFIKRKKLWRLVLEHTSKSNFKVRKISAPDDLEHFNLCALISPDHASTSVAILEAKEIALDFTSESKRAEFLVDFKTVVGERLKEIKQFNAGRDIARNLAHRPRRTSTFDSQQSSPSNLTIRAPLRASTHTANGSSEPLSLTSTRRSIMVVQS